LTTDTAQGRSAINLSPEGFDGPYDVTAATGSITLPPYTGVQNPQPTFHFEVDRPNEVAEIVFSLAVAGPRGGLFPSDGSDTVVEALRNLGYRDGSTSGENGSAKVGHGSGVIISLRAT
jgi:hypothetical protein